MWERSQGKTRKQNPNERDLTDMNLKHTRTRFLFTCTEKEKIYYIDRN